MGNEDEDTMSPLDSQPVAIAEAVKALAASVLACAVLFGVKLSAEQVAGIILVLANLLAVLTLFVVPQRVSTKRTVANAKKDAYLAGRADEATA